MDMIEKIREMNSRIPRCPHMSDVHIDDNLLVMLCKLESNISTRLTFTSGARCVECCKAIGSTPLSSHIKGLAVDISCNNSSLRYKLFKYAIDVGFDRIGVYDSYIHLDVDDSKVYEVVWFGVRAKVGHTPH